MDVKGKGPLLLLLLSTLVLCQNVASRPTCLERDRCQLILLDLHNNATYLTIQMHFNSLEVFLEFIKQYSRGPSFSLPATRTCHTADFITPAEAEARRISQKDLIKLVIRYLLSWNDPLVYLAQEVHHLTKLSDFFKLKEGLIFEQYHQLKELTKEIASQIDPGTTGDVEYASWWGLHSLQSPDENSLLSTYYNMFRCLLTDLQNIESLLNLLKIRVASEDYFNALSIPSLSGMVINNSSFVKNISDLWLLQT